MRIAKSSETRKLQHVFHSLILAVIPCLAVVAGTSAVLADGPTPIPRPITPQVTPVPGTTNQLSPMERTILPDGMGNAASSQAAVPGTPQGPNTSPAPYIIAAAGIGLVIIPVALLKTRRRVSDRNQGNEV